MFTPPNLLKLKIYTNDVKRCMLKVQARRNEEWCTENFILWNIPGLKKAPNYIIYCTPWVPGKIAKKQHQAKILVIIMTKI